MNGKGLALLMGAIVCGVATSLMVTFAPVALLPRDSFSPSVSSIQPERQIFVRVQNISDIRLDQIEINEEWFYSLAPQERSPYRRLDIFNNCNGFRAKADSHQLRLSPIDCYGLEYVPDGYYTYLLHAEERQASNGPITRFLPPRFSVERVRDGEVEP